MRSENQPKHSSRRLITVVAGVAVCGLALLAVMIAGRYRNRDGSQTRAIQQPVEHSEKWTMETPPGLVLSEGMRAFTIHFSEKNRAQKELLHPGCLVDVIEGRKVGEANGNGSATATTLFHDVQVMVVSDDTVTMLVTVEQAHRLALAIKGGISFRVVNPVTK